MVLNRWTSAELLGRSRLDIFILPNKENIIEIAKNIILEPRTSVLFEDVHLPKQTVEHWSQLNPAPLNPDRKESAEKFRAPTLLKGHLTIFKMALFALQGGSGGGYIGMGRWTAICMNTRPFNNYNPENKRVI